MKLDLAKYQDESRMCMSIYGPSGTGKTTTAFTLCKKWPKSPELNKKLITLDDVLYWQWDPDGAISIKPFKIRVNPKHLLNMPAIIAEHGFPRALAYACETAQAIIKANPNIAVEIHDTVSTFDKYSLTNAERHAKNPENTQAIYGDHLGNHRLYSTETSLRPAHVSTIYLFHEKVIDEARVAKAGKAERAKMKAKTMGDMKVHIVPATTGSGGEFYTNIVSLEVSIEATAIPGTPGKFKRSLHPLAHAGRRSKSRFLFTLKSAVPCDLKPLRSKILAACK